MLKSIIKFIILTLIVLGIGFLVWQVREQEQIIIEIPETETETDSTEEQPEEDQNNDTPPTTTAPPATNRSRYADGNYSAVGNYVSPAGQEEIYITLILRDGIIESATFEGRATHPTSRTLQDLFKEGFDQAVIGKNIDELNITVLNGSSLTPRGFNDALNKIKAEAQV